jgi:hypothetical protein
MSDDTRTSTIIQALHILSNEIHSEDWVANGVMVQAADRLEELEASHAELLEALKSLLQECKYQCEYGNFPEDRVELSIARAAIAKAEGEVMP